MKKAKIYPFMILSFAALFVAGCPTPKGPPAPRVLGSSPKYFTLTVTPTPAATLTPVAASPVPSGTFSVTWTPAATWTPVAQTPTPGLPPHPGDSCPGIFLGTDPSFPITVFGDTTGANDDYFASCGDTQGTAGDLVYYFTITSAMNVTVSTCNSTDLTDTTLTLGTSCGGEEVDCNEDACGLPDGYQSIVSGTLTPGTYYITVDGYNNEEGVFQLDITSP